MKRVAVWVLRIVAGLVCFALIVIGGYWWYNSPWFSPKYRQLTNTELSAFVHSLDTTLTDPVLFVGDQFKKHDVVLIGEMHRRKQDVDFVKAVIPYVCRNRGVTVVAWEFGASDFQSAVDSLVNAPAYDERKAIRILRRSSYYWNFQEYLDIFRIIWELNQEIPTGQEKICFLQLGSDYVPRRLHSPDEKVRQAEAERFYYDVKMGRLVEQEVLQKGKKGLWYSGFHHSFTRYHQPRFFFRFRGADEARGGNVLYARYPDRVYLITLHPPVWSRSILLDELLRPRDKSYARMFYPFGGVFDKVYERVKKPFAVDLRSSPFGRVEDNYSYYSIDHWGAITAEDLSDGYVVTCGFDEAKAVGPIKDWITTEEELDEVKAILEPERAQRITSIEAFLADLEEDPPKTIRHLHNVVKGGE